MKITAIIIALNEAEFIQPCIQAIYPFCNRIKIQTGYDKSFSSLAVVPDKTVEKILELPDPEGKISLHICRIPDEAIARNWLMRSDSYRLNHKHVSTTSIPTTIADFCEPADYFWIVDADEIYDPNTIPNIINYVNQRQPRYLAIRGITYFKSWNYRVTPSDNFYQPGFIKPGVLFESNRYIFPPFWSRFFKNKYWNFGKIGEEILNWAEAVRGFEKLPEEVAVFHHASYVGDDQRIFKKISLSTHNHEMQKTWYERVWKTWNPDSKNLHPVNPPIFAGLEYVPTSDLPISISKEEWTNGYLDKMDVANQHNISAI